MELQIYDVIQKKKRKKQREKKVTEIMKKNYRYNTNAYIWNLER